MSYRYQKPHTSTGEYIRTVLVMEGFFNSGSSDLPLFTNGSPALLCRAENDAAGQLTLFGQSVPAEKWTIDNNTTLIAYLFKPFALGAVFGISAQELKDNPVELCNWNAQKTMALNLQLLNAHTTGKRIEILDDFIGKQIQSNEKECKIIKYATDQMMVDPGTEILSKMLAELQLTERTFQRIFKKYVGITPNQYRRLCQFYFAFAQLRGKDFDKLTDIAYTNGYFDQSHYIRSFKEFTDTTPNDYLQYGLTKKNG